MGSQLQMYFVTCSRILYQIFTTLTFFREHWLLKFLTRVNPCDIHTNVARQHYENMPMQYKEIFKVVKNEKFSTEKF